MTLSYFFPGRLLWILSVAIAASNLAPTCGDAAAAERHNVLFIFTDDQRADAIGAIGNPQIKTPNLDAIARRGFVFRNAYCAGSTMGAVCLPSRTMMLSGLSLFHLPRIKADSPDFARSMNAAGYETYHHGKWGNTPHVLQAHFKINKYLANDEKERRSGHPGKEITDAAVGHLQALQARRNDGDGERFFMYLAYANPHDPCVADRKWLDRYDEEQIALPANFLPKHPFDNGELKVRDELLLPWPRTPQAVKRHLRDYYAVTTALDFQIGRLVEELERQKLLDKTFIVVSSDHGLAVGSHGLMGKQNLYEHSMKAPLIFAGPGVPQGQSEALVYLHDIYPTVCELVGAAVPPEIDGRSLAPVIGGEKAGVRDSIFLAYRNVQRAVRRGPWKLIRYPKLGKTQLFNVEEDPSELQDLAGDPGQAQRVMELSELLTQQQHENDDSLAAGHRAR
jgi:arylsulfatase A-like enzyme